MAKTLIIGGGIAGPVAAMALQKAGIESVVYEAHGRGADGVGALLALAVNGLHALRTLELHSLVQERGFDTPRMAIYSGSGRKLAEFPNGKTLADGTVSQTIKRADLYRALRDEAIRRGICIEYGKRLAGAERTPHGVLARFEDGSEAHGERLIGADGLHSRTRQIVDPRAPSARYLGLLNTGGYARGATVTGEPGTIYMIFGKRAFFAYMPHPNGEVWWFANPPLASEPTREELAAISPQRWRAELIEWFAVDTSPAVDLIEATEEIIAPWATYDLPSVPVWHNGRMIVIGDAAHATSPASGQGASMAIEDALLLAKSLRDVPDTAQAFATYERQRRSRVERVVAQGKRNGDYKAVGPVATVVRDLALPIFFKLITRGGHDPQAWLTDYHIAWNTPVEPAARAA
jgi:FAD-dependent urate hydroxylase